MPQQIRRIAEGRLAGSGLNVREANLLRKVLAGDADMAWERDASLPDRIASGALMKQGLIERAENRFVASEDVRFSLGLTDGEGAAPARPEKRQSRRGTTR
jgi:hypothetical protein